MIRFPTVEERGEGVITEILGPRGQPGVDTLSIIRAFGLPAIRATISGGNNIPVNAQLPTMPPEPE